ncbi:MAG: class II glutamine amidotransferase [Candidatus Poribacteria bacterium]
MKNLGQISNPYNDDKVIANCGLFGMMSLERNTFSGKDIIKAIANMRVRGNGLGGGFAAYGIYPDYADLYAFHIMFQNRPAKEQTESFLEDSFKIAVKEEVPHRFALGVSDPPLVWRYFVETPKGISDEYADDYVVEKVMIINTKINDAFVFSSGKDMGVFKGVGHPEDIGNYFCLEDYSAYIWVSHSRFPTNTQAWWGGAHPFSILDWTVVHNGEISSYGTNRNFLEMRGYYCTMHTDTEVMAYAVDLLIRKHRLPVDIAAKIMAAPLWSEIDQMEGEEKQMLTTLRQVYSGLLINGPFTVVIAHQGEMIGLGDRVRLRPLVAGIKDDMLYLSSEEAPMKLIRPDLEYTWIPKGGEPIIGKLDTKEVIYQNKPVQVGVNKDAVNIAA